MTHLTVGVRDLKSQLSKYLREVKAGRTVLITEHGKTVGRIVPADLPLAAKLEAMRRAGLLRWNGKKLGAVKPVARLSGSVSISDIISENRE